MHCTMFSSTPGLYLLDVSNTTASPVVTIKNNAKCALGEQNCSWLRTTELRNVYKHQDLQILNPKSASADGEKAELALGAINFCSVSQQAHHFSGDHTCCSPQQKQLSAPGREQCSATTTTTNVRRISE